MIIVIIISISKSVSVSKRTWFIYRYNKFSALFNSPTPFLSWPIFIELLKAKQNYAPDQHKVKPKHHVTSTFCARYLAYFCYTENNKQHILLKQHYEIVGPLDLKFSSNVCPIAVFKMYYINLFFCLWKQGEISKRAFSKLSNICGSKQFFFFLRMFYTVCKKTISKIFCKINNEPPIYSAKNIHIIALF